MSVRSCSKYKWLIILLTLTTLVLAYLLKIHIKPTAINIEPDLLQSILKPGTYDGISTYDPTEIYVNGLTCKNKLTIVKVNDGIEFINYISAYDTISNELQYKCVRKTQFNYKPNHGNELFKTSKSYIDNTLVSSHYGYAVSKTQNSMCFNLSGSWHISGKEFHNTKNIITRVNDATMNSTFIHYNWAGITDMVMDSSYTIV